MIACIPIGCNSAEHALLKDTVMSQLSNGSMNYFYTAVLQVRSGYVK